MKNAFTLSEVLITLGIIGIVAALSLPSLINWYNKNVTLERLKKVLFSYKTGQSTCYGRSRLF